MNGTTHELREGEVIEIPPSTPHRQLGGGSDPGVVHVTVTPPGRTLEMLRYFQGLGAEGKINRFGFPKPVAGAILVREFAAEGHAARGRRCPCSRRGRHCCSGCTASRARAAC